MRVRQLLHRKSVLVAIVVLLVAAFGAVVPSSASAGSDFVWVLTKTEVNPNQSELPTSATGGAASASHIDWGTTVVPQAEFDIDFALTAEGDSSSPPARLKPGEEIAITATATGQLTGEKTAQGFRWSDVILLVNDRWPGGAITSAAVNCVDPIGAAPISCVESDGPHTGSVTSNAPTFGETFSIGVGVLNCGPCYVRFTYEAKQASPPPSGPTKPSAKGLGIEYSMPARFGKRGKNGLIKYPTQKDIAPKKWRVDFAVRRKDGKPCRQSDILTAKAGKARFFPKGRNPCRFYGLFAKEDSYALRVVLKSGKGANRKTLKASRKVTVQDWLIFGLGDSNGSGEGAPDFPKPSASSPAKWQSRHCHRSARSHQAQAALQLERRDPRTSVTFIHLACSGASITDGLLGSYAGIEPGRSQPPQVKRMKPLSRGRQIDAVIISIGVNDLGFADLVKHCLALPNCPDRGFPTPLLSPKTLHQEMQDRLKSLINLEEEDDFSKLYDKLAGSLKRAGIPAQHVFITEYFDSTKDENGQTCDPLISVPVPIPPWYTNSVDFDRAEAQWASDEILTKLNTAVRAAASKHGWRLVAGAAERFRTHGYCSTDPWIVGLTESVLNQGNPEGTLHSTVRGNREQAVLVKERMQLCFYPKDRTRPPGKSAPTRC